MEREVIVGTERERVTMGRKVLSVEQGLKIMGGFLGGGRTGDVEAERIDRRTPVTAVV